MTYAVIEADGRQFVVEPGKYYDLNHISGEPGDVIQLNKVLAIRSQELISLGQPCIRSVAIRGKILKHIKGRKINIFKMKSKKKARKKQGHRQQLTRLLVEKIFQKSFEVTKN
uniref:Large ribosomal subunit protein bL21c n=1 Tax=Melanthalia intermedia TaxID=172989 RepID=A0A345UAG5_9FLOR|nr:ribosomal protein L21 [Melanthalia intermedia]AXI97451.1 ribosomal protein L21 [Melanthalia intermedia]